MANPETWLWVQDKWYAGLADDSFLGVEGSFLSSENIDNIRNPKGIQLATAPSQIYDLWESDPHKYLLTRFGIEMVFFDKKIYANWTLIYTLTGANDYRNAIEIGNYILVTFSTGTVSSFTAAQVTYNVDVDLALCGYILIENNATMDTAPVIDANAAYRFYGTTSSIELYSYNADFVIVAAWAIIYQWDNVQIVSVPVAPFWWPFTPVWTYPNPPQLTLRLWVQVQNITQFLDQLRFYANVVDISVNQSYLYMINISSLALHQITQVIDLNDMFIRAVSSDWSQDRVITGSDDRNSQLWLMSGTQKQPMHNERPWNSVFRYYNDERYRADFTVFKSFFIGGTNKVDWQVINITWKRYNGYPLQTMAWFKWQNISIISKKNNNIILWDVSGKIYEMYMGNDPSLTNYSPIWNLISRKFYGKHVSNLKDIEILQIGYELPVGCTIDIQLSFNWGTFTTIRTLTGASDEAKKMCLIYKNGMSKTINTEFNYIQMKLILTTTNENVTPVVYDILMLYTEWMRDTLWV